MRTRVKATRLTLTGFTAAALVAGLAAGATQIAHAQQGDAARLVVPGSAEAVTRTTLPILDYLESLRGEPTKSITLTYRNEPMDSSGSRSDFHQDDTLILDAQGNTQSTTRDRVVRTFADFTFRKFRDQQWYVSYSLKGPPDPGIREAEGLLLYFTGSDNYPKDSIGKIEGDLVVYRSKVQDFRTGRMLTLTTQCLLAPVPGQPLCRVLLENKLNATIGYAPEGETVLQPTVKRVLPAGYKPQTHKFKTEKSLTQAAAAGAPPISKARAILGKGTEFAIAGAETWPAAIEVSGYYVRNNTEVVARLWAFSTHNYELFLHAQEGRPVPGKLTFDKSKSLAIIEINFQGERATRIYKAHKGYVMAVQAKNRATAMKLISSLR